MEGSKSARSGSVSRPCTYVARDTAQNECIWIYVIFKRKEQSNDTWKIGKHEIDEIAIEDGVIQVKKY